MHSHKRSRRFLAMLLIALVALAGSASALAKQSGPDGFTATPLKPVSQVTSSTSKDNGPQLNTFSANKSGMVSVIVKLQVASLAGYSGGIAGLRATNPTVTGASKLDPTALDSQRYLAFVDKQIDGFAAGAQKAIRGATVTQKFDMVLGGIAMQVPQDQVAMLRTLPGVTEVYPDSLLQLDTDRSPQFIGAPKLWQALGGQGSAGEGVIVGVLDTGIWPEHPSYSDPDPLGKPYPAPPPPISGTRACQFSGGANPGPAFTCNNKLIGARRFMATYDAQVGLLPGEFTTARDDNGHGTHTSSTAAGNRGVAASIFGVPRGTVSGIAPRAHVIMYKVCGDQGCFNSDSVAAVQRAILDGVNVINFSISGGNDPYADPVELAFLDAYNAGVFVAASAGNAGPTAETVAHRGPWVTTVGASTTDRSFKNTVNVTASGGATLTLTGVSLTAGISTPTPVVSAADAPANDPFCASGTPDGAFTGKIVICERGAGIGRIQKGFNVMQRGAVGMILYNNAANVTDQETDNHYLPASHIQFADGQALLTFLASHTGVMATLTAGVASTQQGDVMASFSSRGGPGQTLGVSKPDVTAPGVQILAGNTPAPATGAEGPAGQLFQAIAGTSMSSPHVAGSAALIKDLHPTWTPGQIKSALMTTATIKHVVEEDGVTPITPFDAGSGRIDLNWAGDPGVTFDASGADYLAFKNQLYRANYPSLYIPSMPGAVTVQRTLHSVLTSSATWQLKVKTTKDLKITTPSTVTVPAGGNGTFDIALDARDVPLGETRFASIDITDGHRKLRFPITIVRGQAPVTLDKTCAPANVPRNSNTTCTLTIVNPLFTNANINLVDNLPSKLQLLPATITGGASASGNSVVFNGTVAASQAATVAIAPGPSPAGGYLPLSLFGIPPVAGVGDDTITNFNVPAFLYGGAVYTQVGFSSNGYVVVGGGTGPDNSINNQNFPNPSRPNNTLALFWTDLNPGAGGAMRIGTLTDGSDTWIVLDWQGVREFSSAGNLHSFQVWIGVNSDAHPAEDVSYAYGPNTGNGDGGFLSVGAENNFGTSGQNTYFNGTGTLPSNGTQLRVTTTPGSVSSKVITFQAKGINQGKWTNYAEMTGDTFFGTNIAKFSGEVIRP
jgi:subtilisin family serine protease